MGGDSPPRPPTPPGSARPRGPSNPPPPAMDYSKAARSSAKPPPLPPKPPLTAQQHQGARRTSAGALTADLLAPVPSAQFHGHTAPTAPQPPAYPPSYSQAAGKAKQQQPNAQPRAAVKMPEATGGVASEGDETDEIEDADEEMEIVPARPRGSTTSQFRASHLTHSSHISFQHSPSASKWSQPYPTAAPNNDRDEIDMLGAGDDGWDENAPTPTVTGSPQLGSLHPLTAASPPEHHRRSRRRYVDRSFGFAEFGLRSGWTTPKLVELGGSEDAVGGIWGDRSVVEFVIDDTPEDVKFKKMGEVVERKWGGARSQSASDNGAAGSQSQAGEEMEMDAVAEPVKEDSPPARDHGSPTYRTISRAELSAARPHPHLYYSRSTHSWALFAPLQPDTAHPLPTVSPYWTNPSTSSTARQLQKQTPLWRVQPLDAEEILPEVEPALPPRPIGPACEASLSKESSLIADAATMPPGSDYSEDDTDGAGVTLVQNQNGERLAFSKLEFWSAIVPRGVWERFRDDRRAEPVVGLSPEESWFKGVGIIWQCLDNLLFKGEYRPVKLDALRKFLSWNQIAADILVGFLGFKPHDDDSLAPPDVSEDYSDESIENRRRLLQCWLEMGIWLEDFKLRHPAMAIKTVRMTRIRLLPSAVPRLLEVIGSDPLPRQPASERWSPTTNKTQEELSTLRKAYHVLGVTHDLADSVLLDVFEQQKGASHADGPLYLQALDDINKHRGSEDLTLQIAAERSQGGYTVNELMDAYRELRLAYPESEWRLLDEDILSAAYSKREEEVTHPDRKKVLREALKLIAQYKGSSLLGLLVSTGSADDQDQQPQMTLERAYRLLDIPADDAQAAGDEYVWMLYEVAINTTPAQKGALTEAVKVIAEARSSEDLQKRLRTEAGPDAGWEAGPSVALDIPVGLTNIANTCYLNSLLQYFFTVRELRETILQFAKGQETDEGAQLNRVGGRLVTQAEVERSKRFVELLQGLFTSLINAPVSAITPETELAYLALVPSKEEAQVKKPAVVAAAAPSADKVPEGEDDDDIIIIDSSEAARTSSSPVVVPSPASPSASEGVKSPSVLGKRRNDQLDSSVDPGINLDVMHLDSQSPHGAGLPPAAGSDDIMVDDSAPLSPLSEVRKLADDENDRSAKRGRSLEASLSTHTDTTEPMKVEQVEEPQAINLAPLPPLPTTDRPVPPPLPPRPPPNEQSDLERQVSDYMAFGRQNDVTECMDNVMFQIECALKPNTSDADDSIAAGVLKRTFYGKTRQQLEFTDTTVAEPVRTKEEPFFSLLVDVAEEGRNVYDGLDAVFDDSPVEIEGKPARRRVSLVEVPALLQIQLQRVQYDREKQKIFKSNQHMAFGPEISLDRYLQVDEDDVEGKSRRSRTSSCRAEMERCRSRLNKLKSKNVDIPKLLQDTFDHLAHQPDLQDVLNSDLGEGTIAEQAATREEVVKLESRINALRKEIEEIWADQHKATYELVSVFIHRGTALSGHYFIYQRDSKNPKRWLKYNDSVITEIDPAEAVFAETTGDTNAYFLVYCKKDRLDAIDSMCRQL